jgi:hypothetical protein
VAVDGFWSISIYNAEGFFHKNDLDAYPLNSVTAKRKTDGSVAVCDGKIANCLPTPKDWNYAVRLYPFCAVSKGKPDIVRTGHNFRACD